MSNTKQIEVKVQLVGGTTTTTVIFAENDFKAKQLVKMQFGDKLGFNTLCQGNSIINW